MCVCMCICISCACMCAKITYDVTSYIRILLNFSIAVVEYHKEGNLYKRSI